MRKLSFLSYIGMLGIPLLLVLIVIAYFLRIYVAIDVLRAILAFVAIGFSIAGIYEVFVNGKG